VKGQIVERPEFFMMTRTRGTLWITSVAVPGFDLAGGGRNFVKEGALS